LELSFIDSFPASELLKIRSDGLENFTVKENRKRKKRGDAW